MKFIEDLIQLLAGEVDAVPVCAIPPGMASAIDAKTQFVYLSTQTVFKQRNTHPELSALDYLTLPTHFADALALLENGSRPRIHFCYQRPNEKKPICCNYQASRWRKANIYRPVP